MHPTRNINHPFDRRTEDLRSISTVTDKKCCDFWIYTISEVQLADRPAPIKYQISWSYLRSLAHFETQNGVGIYTVPELQGGDSFLTGIIVADKVEPTRLIFFLEAHKVESTRNIEIIVSDTENRRRYRYFLCSPV